MSAPRRAAGFASGFTLIESLIALFVLAVGLLGCASLLAWSLLQGGAALRRELALGIASDLAERVRVSGAVPDAAELAAWRTQMNSQLPSLQTSLEVYPPASPAVLERIDITARWPEPRTPAGTASLVLRIHRRASN